MKKIYLLATLFVISILLHSQTIRVEFTHHPNKTLLLTFKNGIKSDTVYNGILDGRGIAKVRIPQTFSGYAGMATLKVNNEGFFDFIVNNENLTIACSEEYPHAGNVSFGNSPENSALQSWFKQQAVRRQKLGLLGEAGQFYSPGDAFYIPLKNEKETLEAEQAAFEGMLQESNLYASRFIRFYNFLNTEVARLAYADTAQMTTTRSYVLDSLDVERLYTSGLWFDTLNGLLALYDNGTVYHKVFIADMSHVLKNIESDTVYTGMAEDLFAICESMGWNDLEEQLAYFLINDGRIGQPSGKLTKLLSLFKLTKGSQAPALSQIVIPEGETLLVFYESGCGNCENEMQQLKGNYPLLQKKGIAVISVSADNDPQVFKNTAASLPWTDKLCDLQGFQGDNFKNYGVMGTPTFFVIDKQSKITGRYARLADTGLINN